MVILD